jgi:hypothetical protein
MRRVIPFAATACLAAAALAAGGPPEADTGREIRGLEAQFGRAVVEGDRASIERVLADDFTHTSHTGVFKTRAEWLAEDKSGARGDVQGGRTRATPTTRWRPAARARGAGTPGGNRSSASTASCGSG